MHSRLRFGVILLAVLVGAALFWPGSADAQRGGSHRIEVVETDYQRFSTGIEVRDGETASLSVGLTRQ